MELHNTYVVDTYSVRHLIINNLTLLIIIEIKKKNKKSHLENYVVNEINANCLKNPTSRSYRLLI